MPAKRTAILNQGRGKQRGAVLMVMLVIMVMGIAAALVNSLSSSTVKTAQQEKTTAALAQAKDALISYAVIYGDTHANPVSGFLPCPDIDGIGTNLPAEGSAKPSCGAKNISMIGRLPWKTLDLSVLRDSDGECLWYAVSGFYKNNPDTDLMNWDTNGQLKIYASDGTLLTQPDNQVVAIIFAPGSALPGQDRSGSTAAPLCGGNYQVSNYLDNDTIHTYNNSDIATEKFIQTHEHRDADGKTILTVNDQMLYITRQDIWNAIKKRNDFGLFVSLLLDNAKTCTADPVKVNFDDMLEGPGQTINNLKIGRVPRNCLDPRFKYWQDNLLYARCITGNCINSNACKGGLIFTGERIASKQRLTNIHKNAWDNYLEDIPNPNLTAFTTGGTTFTGNASYDTALPSTDILVCIP